MVAGPVEAARLIHKYLLVDEAPVSTRKLLVKIIVGEGWFDPIEAGDKADLWVKRFVDRLGLITTENIDAGSYLSFCFNSSGRDFVQGYCYPEPGDSPDRIESKRKRANTVKIYEHVQGIGDREFELLSGRVLGLLKVEKEYVSDKSKDQGIDFFGRVPFGEMMKSTLLHQGAEKNLFVWLVGQSKHYPETKISTEEIRSLVGSVELARAKIFAGKEDPLSELSLRLCDPIFYLFFTTGKFSRDSKDLLARAGVMSFNGLQLAQFLADRAIGEVNGVFEAAAFGAWLQQA